MKHILRLATATTLLLLAACTDDALKPTVPELQQPTAREVPSHVWEILQQYDSQITHPSQSTQPNPAVVTPPFPNYDLYSVTFIWGHLFNVHPGTITTDWSGQVYVNGVAEIRVPFTIDFEPNQDSLVPTTSPASVAWVSTVQGDFDGISLLIFLDRDVVYITPPVLTFDTEQIELQFSFEQLQHFAALYLVDNINAVAVYARKVTLTPCPHGIMTGEWIRSDLVGNSGTFHGLWLESNADTTGIFSGHFWTNNDGARPFEGWVSGYVTDQIIYYLQGTWYYDDPRLCALCGTGHGVFVGTYRDTNNALKGMIKGTFGYAADVLDDHLPLAGVWKQFCANTDFAIQPAIVY